MRDAWSNTGGCGVRSQLKEQRASLTGRAAQKRRIPLKRKDGEDEAEATKDRINRGTERGKQKNDRRACVRVIGEKEERERWLAKRRERSEGGEFLSVAEEEQGFREIRGKTGAGRGRETRKRRGKIVEDSLSVGEEGQEAGGCNEEGERSEVVG